MIEREAKVQVYVAYAHFQVDVSHPCFGAAKRGANFLPHILLEPTEEVCEAHQESFGCRVRR